MFDMIIELGSSSEVLAHLAQSRGTTFIGIDPALCGPAGSDDFRVIRVRYPGVFLAAIGGSCTRDEVLLAIGAGVHGFIAKSVPLPEIVAAIRDIIRGHRIMPASVRPRADVADEAHRIALQMTPVGRHPLAGPAKALSNRETEVLGLIALGKSNKEIARHLQLAEGTVKAHVNAVYRVLGVHNRISAVLAMNRVQPTSY